MCNVFYVLYIVALNRIMKRPNSILLFVTQKAKSIGLGLVYTTLLLYHAWLRSDTPLWAKRIILGALAYLVAPIDGIPDLTPFLGFTDDLGVLSFSLVAIACYVNDEVRLNALSSLKKIFKTVDEDVIQKIDQKL